MLLNTIKFQRKFPFFGPLEAWTSRLIFEYPTLKARRRPCTVHYSATQ